jgi:radical SAM superfamily enzyme YgiQ (UPF0313 family)
MLVSYVGYPNEAFNLIPDNGLANLASCLLGAGHQTMIWDCSTIGTMRELFPYHEKEELGRLVNSVMSAVRRGDQPDEAHLEAYYALEDRIDSFQAGKVRELGRRMAEHVRRSRLDFVGFKLWTGAGLVGSIILAEEIKKANPTVEVFGGGPHVDWFMERTFDVAGDFDVLAYGEGEEAIVHLAEYAEGKRRLGDVANAIYRDRNGRPVINPQSRVKDMDSIPLPCYSEDVYPAMKGNEKIRVVLLDESRGCPNDCHFCIHPLKSGRHRRPASATVFVDRLQQLMEAYGFCAFRFAGSNPPVGLRNDIAAEIVRRDMKVSFSGFAHVRGSQAIDFGLLKEAGCRALAFGVESGSQEILDASMNKHVKVESIRRTLLSCRNAGIAVVVTVIVPAPHETEGTKEETYRLLCETKPDMTTVSYPIMMLGTAWDRDKARFGFDVKDAEKLYHDIMTYRVNVLAPAVLWRPLDGYGLNGKSFRELGLETAAFVQRLKQAGLATQAFDHVFLISEFADMSPAQFGPLAARLMTGGEADEMEALVARINGNILERADLQARSEDRHAQPTACATL